MSALEVTEISKAFGARPVLDKISFLIEKGEACAIIGPSGEGKTTLLRCINLLTAIDHGEVRLDGVTVTKADERTGTLAVAMDPVALRRRVGMVFQEWNLWPNMTILDNIALAPRYVKGMNRAEAEALAEEFSRRVRIEDKLSAYPHSLSGGQKQRAAIARALAMDPEILMLDEVTSALDPVLAAEVLDVVRELKGDRRTLIVVTHHMDFARSLADKVIFLYRGKVHEAGPPQILDEPRSDELRWFLRQVQRVH